ncbi:hypothetical protein B0H21DRAFT_721484 [Amylocystis lapponica]|nr:hypothetical protein B0H21DRAFT_721484 [Amylocystis lapponica]
MLPTFLHSATQYRYGLSLSAARQVSCSILAASQHTFLNGLDMAGIGAQLTDMQQTLHDMQKTQNLMLQELQTLQVDLRRVDANQGNTTIITVNTNLSHRAESSYYMLKKVVPGDGFLVATGVAPNNLVVPDVPPGQVGKVYAQGRVDPLTFSHTDILAVI